MPLKCNGYVVEAIEVTLYRIDDEFLHEKNPSAQCKGIFNN